MEGTDGAAALLYCKLVGILSMIWGPSEKGLCVPVHNQERSMTAETI